VKNGRPKSEGRRPKDHDSRSERLLCASSLWRAWEATPRSPKSEFLWACNFLASKILSRGPNFARLQPSPYFGAASGDEREYICDVRWRTVWGVRCAAERGAGRRRSDKSRAGAPSLPHWRVEVPPSPQGRYQPGPGRSTNYEQLSPTLSNFNQKDILPRVAFARGAGPVRHSARRGAGNSQAESSRVKPLNFAVDDTMGGPKRRHVRFV
jgi:hypothetical protein